MLPSSRPIPIGVLRRLLVGWLALALLTLAGAAHALGPGAGDLTGVVKDAQNNPLRNVRVHFAGPDQGQVFTNANGSYLIPDLFPGSYELFFSKPAYNLVHQGSLTVTANHTTTANAKLTWGDTSTGAVEVRVGVRGSGIPLPETSLALDQIGAPVGQGATDQTGSFVFPGLPAGAYTLDASRAGFRDSLMNRFQVRAGQMTVLALTLVRDATQSGRLAGTVRNLAGDLIKGAKVKIIAGLSSGEQTTPTSGQYQFANLIPGTGYGLQVSAASFQTQLVTGLFIQSGDLLTRDVTLLVAAPTTGSMKGVVTDTSGNPISAASVTLTSGPNAESHVFTAGDGSYTLSDLDPGTYSVQAEADGFSTNGALGVTVAAGGTRVVDLELTARQVPGGSIAGVVREAGTGLLLSDVRVEVLTTPAEGLAVVTDFGGGYAVRDLVPRDSYIVRFTKDGHAPFTQSLVAVTSGETTTLNVQLTPFVITVGNLQGTVKRLGGGVLSDVKVTIFQGPTSPLITHTNNLGSFAFKNLTQGTNYGLRLEKQGFLTLIRTGITVNGGQIRDLGDLVLNRGAEVGNLHITVLDQLNHAVAGAGVTIVDGPTRPGRLETDTTGQVTFTNLLPGSYTIQVTANGFQNAQRNFINVAGGNTTNTLVQLLQQ